MPLDIVVGAQWGDEGKGRIVDLLAAKADLVARYGGGDNAGHTVTVRDQIFRLHLIPSGIVHPHARCLLGCGMVINPLRLIEEIDQLQAAGIDVSPRRLHLSHAAHIITPAHIALDGAEEAQRGQGGLGTTRRGIGPAYSDKAARRGLRAEAMRSPDTFARLVEAHVRATNEWLEKVYALPSLDSAEAGRRYGEAADRLRHYVADVGAITAQALADGLLILAEGAQGTLLDLDHGTYPYVTSSSPTAAGALLGLGVGPGAVRRVIGVVKAFQTRVGSGPFPTEITGPLADRLRGSGQHPWDEFGTTTGRPRRIGWLDGVLLRYAVRVNGLTELALSKLDILTGLNPIRFCYGYRGSQGALFEPPLGGSDLEAVTPLYEDLLGWGEPLSAARSWQDLPSPAREYVERVEQQAGVPVRLISVGPERGQVIWREWS